MKDLLFLAHRIPYPPNKGDKIRSWHLLRHLAERYRVHLGCFVDDAQDHRHEPVLRDLPREAEEAAQLHSACHASSNRTCELGLTAATGEDYEHVLEILERVSR